MSDAILCAYYTPHQGFFSSIMIILGSMTCGTDGGTATAHQWDSRFVSSKVVQDCEEDDDGAEKYNGDDCYA